MEIWGNCKVDIKQPLMEKKNTVIIGAGLVGSLLSIYLSKRGYNVKIFDNNYYFKVTR